MSTKWISTSWADRGNEAPALPSAFLTDESRPQDYIMDEGLEAAANVAIELGQPLLLTGAPGTGKTRFADHLAFQLGLGRPLAFHTKSNSAATDLFYTYDAVRSFRSAQSRSEGGPVDEWGFVNFNALGLAILRSLQTEQSRRYYRGNAEVMGHPPQRSVVLIDEIDKAPRDFPNDILHEIPSMSFRVAELDTEISASKQYRPIVVITSNTERPLPDAFLRRCVFHHIEQPEPNQLRRIIVTRFPKMECPGGQAVLDWSLGAYAKAQQELNRPPSTSEFIGWLQALMSGATATDGLNVRGARLASVMAKSEEDLTVLRKLLLKHA